MFFILYLEILVHVLIFLFQAKDWWSYEFCYGKYIRQFHVEGKAKTNYIVHVFLLIFLKKNLIQ